MTRSLNRISLLILVGFCAVALSLVYWSVLGSDSMLARSDNPRRVESERALIRGSIYDRTEQVLAQTLTIGTSPSGQPVVERAYPYSAASTAVGYYSLVHGVGGVEAAYDRQLRGDDLLDAGQAAANALLHRPQVGSDVRLTLDIRLQTVAVDAFQQRRGGLIVIDVPSGAVLAMVSTPTFDPNSLDNDYDALLKDPSAPLLNRVTQGLYQPGGSLETIILASMLTRKGELNGPVSGASTPVEVNGLTLKCAAPGTALLLKDAYSLACPWVFVDETVANPQAVQTMLGAFGLLQAPLLTGFQTVSSPVSNPLTQTATPGDLHAEGAGQGKLTVTPFQMALAAATIANGGNTVAPYLVDATRAPGAKDWTPLNNAQSERAVITQAVASSLGTAMRDAVVSGAAHAADRPGVTDLVVHGHASTAFTGPRQQQAAWFVGYAELPKGHLVAIAVTVEGADVSVAAQIGGVVFQQEAALIR